MRAVERMFRVESIPQLIPRPTPLPGALGDCSDTFAETSSPRGAVGSAAVNVRWNLAPPYASRCGRRSGSPLRALRFAARKTCGGPHHGRSE